MNISLSKCKLLFKYLLNIDEDSVVSFPLRKKEHRTNVFQ